VFNIHFGGGIDTQGLAYKIFECMCIVWLERIPWLPAAVMPFPMVQKWVLWELFPFMNSTGPCPLNFHQFVMIFSMEDS